MHTRTVYIYFQFSRFRRTEGPTAFLPGRHGWRGCNKRPSEDNQRAKWSGTARTSVCCCKLTKFLLPTQSTYTAGATVSKYQICNTCASPSCSIYAIFGCIVVKLVLYRLNLEIFLTLYNHTSAYQIPKGLHVCSMAMSSHQINSARSPIRTP